MMILTIQIIFIVPKVNRYLLNTLALDVTEIITWVSLSIGAIVGGMTLRSSWLNSQKKTREEIQSWISKSDERIIDHLDEKVKIIDSKFQVVDTRIAKDEEDIEDVEDDMKAMVKQFQEMCNKLSKHDFIIDKVLPEFKELKKEFEHFRTAVDTQLAIKGSIFVKKDEPITKDENK